MVGGNLQFGLFEKNNENSSDVKPFFSTGNLPTSLLDNCSRFRFIKKKCKKKMEIQNQPNQLMQETAICIKGYSLLHSIYPVIELKFQWVFFEKFIEFFIRRIFLNQ